MNQQPLWYCEAHVFSEGRCERQCVDCADCEAWGEDVTDDDTGEDPNVEDSHAR
jgi:hypothetical protein